MAFRIMRLKRQARWSNRLQEIFLVIIFFKQSLCKMGIPVVAEWIWSCPNSVKEMLSHLTVKRMLDLVLSLWARHLFITRIHVKDQLSNTGIMISMKVLALTRTGQTAIDICTLGPTGYLNPNYQTLFIHLGENHLTEKEPKNLFWKRKCWE